MCKNSRRPVQILDSGTQNSRSASLSRARPWRCFRTASCCRRARFSIASARWVRSANHSVRPMIPSHLSIVRRLPPPSEKRQLNLFGRIFRRDRGSLPQPETLGADSPSGTTRKPPESWSFSDRYASWFVTNCLRDRLGADLPLIDHSISRRRTAPT